MAGSRKILSRIKSAKNISQITKAMQMVSAAKMKKAQDQALSGSPYSIEMRKILISLLKKNKEFEHAFLVENKEATRDLCIFVTTNKGLCGGLNTNHFRFLNRWENKDNCDYLTIGKKGRMFCTAMGKKIIADFSELPENIDFTHTLPISKIIINEFKQRQYRRVYFSYNEFKSTLVQTPRRIQLLPIENDKLRESLGLLDELTAKQENESVNKESLFEPDANTLIEWLLPYYIELEVYHYLLENKACEHSARMVAMKSASENAKDVMKNLRLTFNRLRQQQVTSEIADVVVAILAVE